MSLYHCVRPSVPLALRLAALMMCLLGATPVEAQSPSPPRSGEQIYGAACAHCHGPSGKGVPAARLSLPVDPPDFTSCSFASREPDGDWGSIIAGGGPVRAFDRTMPAFGDALSDEEIQRALDHVRTFCAERSWPRGELNLPRALVTEKAYPEDELVVTTAVATEGEGAATTKVIYEKRFGAQNQVEFVVPIAANGRDGGSWQAGLGDMAIAVKRALVHSHQRGTILSATGELILPTGDAARDLGKGYAVFEPFVTFGQILPRDSFFQFQGGFEFPTSDEGANEAFWRFALGKSFAQNGGWGRTWSPMLEILGAKELVDGERVQWDLVPQVQVTLSTRQHIMLNVGVRFPLTESGPRSTQFVMYLLWDWFDGGFFDGW